MTESLSAPPTPLTSSVSTRSEISPTIAKSARRTSWEPPSSAHLP